MPERTTTKLRQSLGITLNEAKVYLAALELGHASMTQIAKKARMARTSAYSVVEHLLERGFLMEYQQGKKVHYVATPPEKLVHKLHEQEEKMQRLVPLLQKLNEKRRVEPRIRVITGDEGVREVLREILAEKRPFRAMTAVTDMRIRLEDEFDDFIKQRAKQRLKVHLLTNRSSYTQKMKAQDGNALRVTRFLPTEKEIHTATYIFGNKVAMIGIQDEPPVSVIIEDPSIAKTHELTFDLLWRIAETN